MGLLHNKVVVITGAGGGLGAAYARLFASEGARLFLCDTGTSLRGEGEDPRIVLELVSTLQALHPEDPSRFMSHTKPAHTSDGAQILMDAAIAHFGRVDVLVNNAGILRDQSLMKMELAEWNEVLSVHLNGTFFCTQIAAKHMVHQGTGGRIVNTISSHAFYGNFGQANYVAATSGIYGLTRTSAIELQRHGITVNAVAPLAKTRMTETLPMFQTIKTMTPEHVAPAALFFASDLCGLRTGHVLAAAGSRMYSIKLMETPGKFKDEESGRWSAEEIDENWDSILKA